MEIGGSSRVVRLLEGTWGDYFKSEVLARDLALDGDAGEGAETMSVEGEELRVRVERLGKIGVG